MKESAKEVVRILEARKKYLEEKLKDALQQEARMKNFPMHKIRIQKHGNGYQYYLRANENDTVGKYIPKEQEKLVKETLQKEYLQKSIAIMQKEILIIGQYLGKASPTMLEKYYEDMTEGRKRMIDVIEPDDKEYVKIWQNVSYEGKDFWDGMPEYYTQKGERVRSKSEIIIANTLNYYGIPYRYEYPILVHGLGKVYPDFTVLNVRKRKEMYWEHFGLVDDSEYRENAIRKISIYERNNIYVGDNLIVTCESTEQPLNSKEIERKIEKHLL